RRDRTHRQGARVLRHPRGHGFHLPQGRPRREAEADASRRGTPRLRRRHPRHPARRPVRAGVVLRLQGTRRTHRPRTDPRMTQTHAACRTWPAPTHRKDHLMTNPAPFLAGWDTPAPAQETPEAHLEPVQPLPDTPAPVEVPQAAQDAYELLPAA